MRRALRCLATLIAATHLAAAPALAGDPPRLDSPLVVVGEPPAPGVAGVMLDHDAWRALRAHDEAILEGFILEPGRSVSLRLERVDPFSPGAQLVEVTARGEVALPAPDIAILVGSVEGEPGSHAFVALAPAACNARITIGDDVFVVSSGPWPGDTIVAYRLTGPAGDGLRWIDWRCAVGELDHPAGPPHHAANGDVAPAALCRVAQVAIETDWEFTGALFGGDTGASAAYAATLVGAVSEIFKRDTNMALSMSYLRVWANSSDPWDRNDTVNQLYQFRDYWRANMGSIQRDDAHFLSGRPLGGGVAWLPGFCTDYAYALSANLGGFFPYPLRHNDPNNWDPFVVAHEFGHNFGAPHTHEVNPPIDRCGQGDCSDARSGTIMSYCHTCSGGMRNIRLEFHTRTVNESIVPFLDASRCKIPCPPCWADCDTSGTLDIRDFFCFQAAFAARDEYADCDGNGTHDIRDFFCFQSRFASGCP